MKVNPKAFKGARKKDVIDYLSILSNNSISCGKVDFKDSLPDTRWGYRVEGLTIPFEISTLKHIRPEGFTSVEVIVDLDLESQVSEWLNLNDPFTSLSFRSLLKGTNVKTGRVHYLSFHIDRHSGGVAHEIHPLYHLQYLQNAKVKAKDDFDHGESLQLDVPRMMHFPMELILGVSFLLSNFSPVKYEMLVNDRQYVNLCKQYQERVWRPYINSLESFWASNPNQWVWNPKLNCPYLL